LNGNAHIIVKSNLGFDLPDSLSETPEALNAANTVIHREINIYAIIRHLYQIAPSILTTVIGTIAHGLILQEEMSRQSATQLLGDLFTTYHLSSGGAAFVHTDAKDFRCFCKVWLGRSNDVSVPIRRCMVNCLVKILKSAYKRLAPGDEISATTINAAATSH